MKRITPGELFQAFDGFLLDAYGVLVDSEQTLPGANAFLEELRRRGKPFRIVSNDGSTTPEAKSEKWSVRGLHVLPGELITPWSVLSTEFSPVDVKGKRCLVVGTPLSREMLLRCGGVLASDEDSVEVFLLADELTPDLMGTCNIAISRLVDTIRGGVEPTLVLVNPDLVYPTSGGYGFTAGALALMFEAALRRILGRDLLFTSIGKPSKGLFEVGLARLGINRSKVVMLGDQWDTDILGANLVGIASVLLTTGLGRIDPTKADQLVMDGFGGNV